MDLPQFVSWNGIKILFPKTFSSERLLVSIKQLEQIGRMTFSQFLFGYMYVIADGHVDLGSREILFFKTHIKAPSTRIRRFLYPQIFFMRIHLASTRVRRIRSVYPEISVYALQSGNFCIRCVSGYVWTLVSVYFCIR